MRIKLKPQTLLSGALSEDGRLASQISGRKVVVYAKKE